MASSAYQLARSPAGPDGYQQRTEFNKRLMFIGADGAEINPEGGFPG